MKKSRTNVFLLLSAALLLVLVVVVGCGGGGDTTTTQPPAGGDTGTSVGTETTEATPPADGKTYELKIAHIWPAGHAIETDVVQPWAKEISDVTGGKVKIVSYPGQTLVKGPEVYDGVVNGITDIGISVYGYNAGRFPIVEAFLLPGISWQTAKASGAALTDGLKQLDAAEIKDTHVLMSFATGPGEMLMKTPVRKLEDVKGLEIGATAGPRGDGLKLLGATPVVLPMPEVYEAQSRGVIQGVIGPYEAMTGFKLADVTDYITDTPFLYVNFFYITMNKNTWDSLPAEYQKAITQVSEKYYNDVVLGLFDRLNQEALDAAMAKKKIEIITLSDQEQARWKDKLQPVFDDYKAVLDGKGLDGAAILAKVQELANKYNSMYPAK